LLEHALGRSRLVLMNEAHSGRRRCLRTREVGRRLLPIAHRLGIRHIAMEALWDSAVTERANRSRMLEDGLDGYLGQPEMRALVQAALDLGWTLHGYEADIDVLRGRRGPEDRAAVNWREDQQARNLGAIVAGLPQSESVLGWCGNGHLCRRPGRVVVGDDSSLVWTPMGSLVAGYCGIEPFAIDQTATAAFAEEPAWLAPYREILGVRDGTAGFLADDAPEEIAWLGDAADGYLLSLDNALVE
jgi:hypothetical protein